VFHAVAFVFVMGDLRKSKIGQGEGNHPLVDVAAGEAIRSAMVDGGFDPNCASSPDNFPFLVSVSVWDDMTVAYKEKRDREVYGTLFLDAKKKRERKKRAPSHQPNPREFES